MKLFKNKFKTATILLSFCFMFFSIKTKAQFFLNGTASQIDQNCWRLTPATLNATASIWHEDQISLMDSFDMTFNMNFGCSDVGADGIVFVFQTSPTALGEVGNLIGYGPTFDPSLGVEFDTYDNDLNNDINPDHIAIQRDGNVNHGTLNNLAGPITASVNVNNIEDCEDHIVRIVWDAGSMLLSVYFDCDLRLTYTGDIVNEIFDGDPIVYWGFVASTGGESNEQIVCFNSLESTGGNETLTTCEGEDAQLNAPQTQANSYTWTPSTGLSDPNIANPIAALTENTSYVVTGVDQCGNDFSDTINVTITNMINVEIEPAFSDTMLCFDDVLDVTIQTDANNEISWQNGASTDSIFSISQSGSYQVEISNECFTTTLPLEVEYSDCVNDVVIPNAFTPDADGVNDLFRPLSEIPLDIIQFKIFNRWGELVYDGKNQQGWDGTDNGNPVPTDVYIYMLEYSTDNGESEKMSGDVTLIR